MQFFYPNSIALSGRGKKQYGGLLAKRIPNDLLATQVVAEKVDQLCGTKLVESMQQLGSRSEFERLVKDHLDSTLRLAIRLTNHPDLAEELVQETMLRATRGWESFRHKSQFKTWLYRILINVFRDHLRKPKVDAAEVLPDECASPNASVVAKAAANETAELIGQLIAQLPDRQREVLVLATYESMTTEQIATTLNITTANVYANLSTARKRLKEQLGMG